MQNIIRSKPMRNCKCCHSEGTYLYQSLQDRLFGADGKWNLKQCNNLECGLLWLDPMPVQEDIYKAYQNYYTHANPVKKKKSLMSKLNAGYKASVYDFMVHETQLIQRLLGRAIGVFGFLKEYMDYPFVYFKNASKGKFLELGSGNGDTLKLFKDWGWQVEGLDFDDKAVENASRKGLLVHQGDIFRQKFSDNSFDAIFSSHVLEHVPDAEALLNESFRILKPGGCFVVITPNAQSKLHKKFKMDWRGLEPPRHLYIFNPKSILNLTLKTDFKKVKVSTGNYSAVHIWLTSCNLRSNDHPKINSIHARYFSHFVHFCLNVMHRFSPYSGEELILIAYK